MRPILKLNGQPESYPETIDDLEALIVHIMQQRGSGGEIIVNVRVDGQVFSEAYDHQARDIRLADLESIHMSTVTAEWFSRRFVEQVVHYIDHLKKGFQNSVRLLRNPAEQRNGYELLANSIDTLCALRSHLRNVRDTIGKDGTESAVERVIWQQFEGIADLVCKAQGENNPTAVAALIEGKVMPVLEEWKDAA